MSSTHSNKTSDNYYSKGPSVKVSAKDQLFLFALCVVVLLVVVVVLYFFGGKSFQTNLGSLFKNSFNLNFK